MFLEIRFPTLLGAQSRSNLMRRTEVAELGSGYEERNAVWAHSRRRYQVGHLIRTPNEAHAVIDLFEAANGRLRGFRFRDVLDYKSCPPENAVTPFDQVLGTGDGTTASFQLRKTYPSGYVRVIKKPVAGTVRVAVNGAERTAGVHFNVDVTTGIVTFTGGNVPLAGHVVTAGYEFDVPVRFDTDSLDFERHGASAVDAPDVPLIEIRI